MSRTIEKLYKKRGVSMRSAGIKKGKGIHTKAAHECVINYVKKGVSSKEAWRRCMGALGAKAIHKKHRRKKRY